MLEDLLMWLGFGLCHQLPERSFFGGGLQVPVCARDTGIYIGFVVSLVVIVALSRRRRPAEMPPVWLMAVGVLFVVLMGVDGVSSYAGWRETTNDLRLLTGLLTGFALPLALVPILNGQVWKLPGSDRVLDRPRDAVVWLASVPVAFAIVRWALPATGALYPVLTAAVILATFTAVNLAIVCLLPPFERRYGRLREAWVPLLLAFAFTVGELWLTGALKGLLLGGAGLV